MPPTYYRCSLCRRQGHNARNCPEGRPPSSVDVRAILRAALPGWIDSARRVKRATERVQELLNDELLAAWDEQRAAIENGNEISLAYTQLVRMLPPDERDEIFRVLREDGFTGLARALGAGEAAAA